MHITTLGIPYTCGGANTELGDTILLLRRHGVAVTVGEFQSCRCANPVIPWTPENPWRARLEKAGCFFRRITPDTIAGLGGTALLAMANQHALHYWPALAKLGHKLIWSPAMTYTKQDENVAFNQAPPTVLHVQSKFQLSRLAEEYCAWGCTVHHLIRGAFEPLPFNPSPRHTGKPFVVGRLARPCRTKWSPDLWKILGAVRDRGVDLTAFCMGWTPELSFHCGPPPQWSICLEPDTWTAEWFMGRCHAMICANWAACENWPRIGLEGMSSGVPLLVDDLGGWREMCGEAAIYCKSPGDYVDGLTRLASDEEYRQKQIEAGRKRVAEVSCPARIAGKWKKLLASL